jgi:type II secretory pathway component PulF
VIQNKLILAFIVFGGIVFAIVFVRKVSRMGEAYDEFLFRIPMFGPLFKGAALMKVTRTMRDLLQNGVSMVETLRLTSTTVGKNQIETKLNELRLAVEEGGSFSRNLAGGGVFPDTMVWKLQMAEEKGIIEEALAELANEFEVDVDVRTTLITKLLSPMLLLVMGGVVFLMFLACFEPLTRSAAMGG